MSEQSAFDPTKYLTRVNGKEYLEVKWRLVWMRAMHPEAAIVTELVEHGNNMAVFRATVSLPSGASASGWGSESAGDFHDYLEKAETKALGRALAALGFGTQFCHDFEFGAEQQRVVDSPVELRANRQRPAEIARQEATPRQIKYLHVVAREVGLSTEDLEQRSQETFGEELSNLGRRDISALIEQIQSERQSQSVAS